MAERLKTLPDGTHIVAVRTLYATLTPTVIMAVAFLGVGAHVAIETRDWLLTPLVITGGVAVLARLGVLLLNCARAGSETLDAAGARKLERWFAVPYFAFAAAFGAFSARAFHVATAESHVLIVGLLFGYGAGVAAGIFLRPWIALPSILLAVVPAIVSAMTVPDFTYSAVSLLLLLFLLGGIQSMMRNYRAATAEITARRTFATLARSDVLTGLENRLSLRDAFDTALGQAAHTTSLPFIASTSIGSRRSTTPTATLSATRSCRPFRHGCAAFSGRPTWRPGSAATSSYSSKRASSTRERQN